MTRHYGFGRAPTQPPESPIVPLRAQDVGQLDLGWSSLYTPPDLEQYLLAHPGLSWWAPGSGEYLICGPWRHRTEIAVISELRATLRSEELVDACAAACREQGTQLLVMIDQPEGRRGGFYRRIGFELVQEILVYELPRLPYEIPPPAALRFTPLTSGDYDDLLAIDRAAFPWLWWNSAAEFAAYTAIHGVEIFLGREADGVAVAYFGITGYRGWGHLDRIAVIPERQSLGYGLEALNAAAARLAQHGARRIGLSTQADNVRSQHLYERYGFRRAPGNDYAIYGRWLNDTPATASLAP